MKDLPLQPATVTLNACKLEDSNPNTITPNTTGPPPRPTTTVTRHPALQNASNVALASGVVMANSPYTNIVSNPGKSNVNDDIDMTSVGKRAHSPPGLSNTKNISSSAKRDNENDDVELTSVAKNSLPGLPSIRSTTKDRTLPLSAMLVQTKVRLMHQILIIAQEVFDFGNDDAAGEVGQVVALDTNVEPHLNAKGNQKGYQKKWKKVMDMLHKSTGIGMQFRPVEKTQTFSSKVTNALVTWHDFMEEMSIDVVDSDGLTPLVTVAGKAMDLTDTHNWFFLFVHKAYMELIKGLSTGKKLHVMCDTLDLDTCILGRSESDLVDLDDSKLSASDTALDMSKTDSFMIQTPYKKRARLSGVAVKTSEANYEVVADSITNAANSLAQVMCRGIALERERSKIQNQELALRIAKHRVDIEVGKAQAQRLRLESEQSALELLEKLEVKIATSSNGNTLLVHWKNLRKKCIDRLNLHY